MQARISVSDSSENAGAHTSHCNEAILRSSSASLQAERDIERVWESSTHEIVIVATSCLLATSLLQDSAYDADGVACYWLVCGYERSRRKIDIETVVRRSSMRMRIMEKKELEKEGNERMEAGMGEIRICGNVQTRPTFVFGSRMRPRRPRMVLVPGLEAC